MKATELRIGNYYQYAGDSGIVYTQVQAIKYNQFGLLSDFDGTNFEICKPIELTEEWVKKLGFKLVFAGQGDGFIYEYGKLCNAMTIHSRNRNIFLYSTFNTCEINIQYVHQLQNLYFALTGEELSL